MQKKIMAFMEISLLIPVSLLINFNNKYYCLVNFEYMIKIINNCLKHT